MAGRGGGPGASITCTSMSVFCMSLVILRKADCLWMGTISIVRIFV